jgi:hypothetical protein
MALHWSIERVKDWREIANDAEQRAITEAVVWSALVYDLSNVTEKNIVSAAVILTQVAD